MTERQYAAAGVDLADAEAAKERIARAGGRAPGPRSRSGAVGAFGGMVRVPAGIRKPVLVHEHRRRRAPRSWWRRRRGGSTPWARTWSTTASTTSWCTAPRPIAFMDYVAGAGLAVEQIAEHRRGGGAGLPRPRDGAGRRRDGADARALPPGHFDLAGTIVGVVEEDEALHGDQIAAGRRAAGLRVDRPPHQRLHPGPADHLRPAGPPARTRTLADTGHDAWPRRCSRCTGATRRRCAPVLGAAARRWPTSPAAASRATWSGCCREGCARCVDVRRWTLPPLFRLLQEAGGVCDEEMRDVFNLGVGHDRRVARRPRWTRPGPPRRAAGVETWVIGEVRAGKTRVRFA